MATEESVTEHAGRNRHQLKTLILAGSVASAVLLAVGLTVAYATLLNQYWFLHFPVGFYLLAQGLIFGMVAAAFWYVRAQERIDHARSETEGLE